MNIRIEKIKNVKAEIPFFSLYEQSILKIDTSYEKAWMKYYESDRDLCLYYLKNENKIIGILGLTTEKQQSNLELASKGDKYSFLMCIGIYEKYRGIGFGKKLLEVFINESMTKDIDYMGLRVDPKNKKAIALYKKYGFKSYYQNEISIYMKRNLRLK